jgi:hypothetical protein
MYVSRYVYIPFTYTISVIFLIQERTLSQYIKAHHAALYSTVCTSFHNLDLKVLKYN